MPSVKISDEERKKCKNAKMLKCEHPKKVIICNESKWMARKTEHGEKQWSFILEFSYFSVSALTTAQKIRRK